VGVKNGDSMMLNELFQNMNPKIVSLYSYWVRADSIIQSIHVKHDYSEKEKQFIEKAGENITQSAELFLTLKRIEVFYALIYTLIEGYREINILDSDVDILLLDEYVDKLRLFRNAIFHFQKEPISEKLLGFLENKDSEHWINKLHNAFKNYFIKYLPINETLNELKWE
jgi:hypothetical protein